VKRLLVMIIVLACAVYVGCKQQDGDRCQVNEDCESGECNMSKGTCTTGGGNTMDDAEVPMQIDAAPMADAMGDAMGDAMADAP
jgi:hypothetical protein